MVSQLCLLCGSTLNCQTLCLGARPRYSLVVDEDVKKPTNQPTPLPVTASEKRGERGRERERGGGGEREKMKDRVLVFLINVHDHAYFRS